MSITLLWLKAQKTKPGQNYNINKDNI
ncbi:uncharacterized protein METZ01_LOCUS442645 [marine metagenome]|uniref:Uncharacterized protein n=1 Tax=marine metagenome TaxID=408172 RepID=A0A382Z2X0_9ZZZZ